MESAKKFDKIAEVYDTGVRNLLPQYDELRKILFDFVPFSKDDKINVLDLGMGTGTTAAEFLERYPAARLIGVDVSSKMIEQSRQKLEQFKSRTELVQCNFKDFQPNDQFDIVYSILAVHHVPDEDKEALFRRIREILKPEGAFIMIDLVNGTNDTLTERYQTLSFGRAHKVGGSVLSLMEYIQCLRKIGFQTVDVAWKQYRLACIIAFKT
jgi:tRNA (cmo5U34)-methyltransferase